MDKHLKKFNEYLKGKTIKNITWLGDKDMDWDETEGGKKTSKDIEDVMGKKNLKRKKKTRKIEYEYETEEGGKEKLLS